MLVSTNVLAAYLWTSARGSIGQRQELPCSLRKACVAHADWEVQFRWTVQGSWAGRCASVISLTVRAASSCHFFLSLCDCAEVWAPQAAPFSFKHQHPHGIGSGDANGRLFLNAPLSPPCLPSTAARQSVGPPHLHCGSSALYNLWAPKGDPSSVISIQGSYLDVFFLLFPKPRGKPDTKIITFPAFRYMKCSQHSKTGNGKAFLNTRNNIRPPPPPVIFSPVAPSSFEPWSSTSMVLSVYLLMPLPPPECEAPEGRASYRCWNSRALTGAANPIMILHEWYRKQSSEAPKSQHWHQLGVVIFET